MQEEEGRRADEESGESRGYCWGRCCRSREEEEDGIDPPASSRKMLHAPGESAPADGLNYSDRARIWLGRAIRDNSDARWDRQMRRC